METNWVYIAGAVLFSVGLGIVQPVVGEQTDSFPNQNWQERLEGLEQKQKILERKLEIGEENVAAKAKDAAGVTTNAKDGFTLKSADGSFVFKLTGYVQTDYRKFLNDDSQPLTDQFLLRRVRPSLEGTINKVVDFRILPDFGGGTTVIQDAWLDLKYWPQLRLRVGKFKQPFGLERLQSGTSIVFVERAYPTSLAPNRDIGLQLHGELLGGIFNYAAGAFNGVVDGGSVDGDTTDSKDFTARIFLTPFKNGNSLALKGLGLGLAGSTGKHAGTTTSTGLASYKTPGQNTFFSYRSDVTANGRRVRLSPQTYWYPGSFGVLAEYVSSVQEVKRATTTTTTAEIKNNAWQVAASYVLTGEKASYKGVKPLKPFDPANRTWGALELAVRYSELKVDQDVFTRYADPAKYARLARTYTGGFNWYLNTNVKVTSDYEYTWFKGGASSGNRSVERAVLSRFQIVF